MTDIERESLDFLKRWLAWAEAGAVTDEFWPRYGLCSNSPNWEVSRWLRGKFSHDVHPFGRRSYASRTRHASQHKCPKRLAWVRAKIAEMEQAQ